MIRIADVIPNVSTMHKKGVETEWKSTHKLFENKKIVLYAKRGYSQMFIDPIKLNNWRLK